MILNADGLLNLGNELTLTVDNILYFDSVGDTTLRWTLPRGNRLGDKIAVSGKFVYNPSRYYGRLLVSDWKPQSVPTDVNIESIAWSPELRLFCAVARTGTNRVMTSPNGINWTAIVSPEQNSLRAVAWGDGKFIAVASSGTNRIFNSEDGINWETPLGAPSAFFTNITYGQGKFVILIGGTAYISSNGLTWQSNPCSLGDWRSCAYSPSLDLFVVTGIWNPNNTERVMTSSDAINWTLINVSPEIRISSWWSICWSDELGIFCSVGSSDDRIPGTFTYNIMTSDNGIDWEPRAIFMPESLLYVCWSPELRLFCAIKSANSVVTSPNGIDWTERELPVGNYSGSVWSPELYLFCIGCFDGTGAMLITPL